MPGTDTVPYIATEDREPGSTQRVYLQSIVAMPAYRRNSLEELRVGDYQKGRRPASEPVSARENAAPTDTPRRARRRK
ncbi:hypothetical protein BOTBODRAFT_38627 [Botryobasidium botryosum FD-172 SS1]|uniref:Uncharacterized protein n=1 Tax=Botryobasidium botryosum (strain FD-172 SS1) TaxID=930990 RepID=A0A067LZ33_BOTB1|nr:hypothetical protein BOTBODRAFT_38627 [Botryobasidium botryosum FD-172 SS1]